MSRFGDPGFVRHAASAALGAGLLLRLANADVLPYDYAEFARTMAGYLPGLEEPLKAKGWDASVVAPLRTAVEGMQRAAAEFATARDAALAGGRVDRARADAANAALLRVERALTRPEGLKGREWFRNLIYASDPDNGYADMIFPGAANAVRQGDRTLAEAEVADLAHRFTAATQALVDARAALGGSGGR
jgi:N-acetylated-alpha-linked acidic dipeptidase